MSKYILDDNGNPMKCTDPLEWAGWFETAGEKRIVARDQIGDVLISTVFLGLDHNFDGHKEPILWETMIFGGPHNEWQERASTKEGALSNHRIALQLVRRA